MMDEKDMARFEELYQSRKRWREVIESSDPVSDDHHKAWREFMKLTDEMDELVRPSTTPLT
jgi:tRNA splicing ligase